MSNLYIENAEKWKTLADIDFITQFVKAWISFNAWYKNSFPDLKTDKDAINTIKGNSNKFRDKLESLLNGTGDESSMMKSVISNLHYQLERHYIHNNNIRISFEDIVIGINPKRSEEFLKYSWKYEVVMDRSNHKLIESKITNKHGVNKLLINQTNGYDIDELKRDAQYLAINSGQRGLLEDCYNAINPRKSVSMLAEKDVNGVEEESMKIGAYNFKKDVNIICNGVISILYLLRNSLFHGQIIPDKETNKVYEQAYHILHKLVDEL